MGLGLAQPGEKTALKGYSRTPPAPTHRLTRRWVQVLRSSMWKKEQEKTDVNSDKRDSDWA